MTTIIPEIWKVVNVLCQVVETILITICGLLLFIGLLAALINLGHLVGWVLFATVIWGLICIGRGFTADIRIGGDV